MLDKNSKFPNPFRNNRSIIIIAIVLVFSLLMSMSLFTSKPITQETFFTNLEKGKYTDVIVTNEVTSNALSLTVTDNEGKQSSVSILNSEKNMEKLEDYSSDSKTNLKVVGKDTTISTFSSIFNILFLAFAGFLFYKMIKTGMGGGVGVQTNTQTTKVSKKSTVTFANIAGKQEEKEEFKDIINYYKDSTGYTDRGISIPRGILLEGPPGTGKTLLAKGLAGEIDANFFYVSGADFNGMYRGTGTAKIKSIFKEAREHAPSIIFIDEIDALAKKRGGTGASDRDSEQTLNQLLTELDGFHDLDKKVVILGATNLAESLDPALLRSGRFDRKVYVGLPNKQERKEILGYYVKDKKLDEDVNLDSLVEELQSFSGADIELVVNEANLISYNNKRDVITSSDFEKALNKIVAGVEKKSTVYSKKQKVIIANHESGHALLGSLLQSAKKVKKVTIIPHGRAGGFAMMIPKEELAVHTKDYIENTIKMLLAGRGAEEILSNTQTTGVYQDIKEASDLARNMITQFGMSGSLQFVDMSLVDKEKLSEKVDEILNNAYKETKKVINDNIPRINLLSRVLQEKETIFENEIDYIVSLDNEKIDENFDSILTEILDMKFEKPIEEILEIV